MPIFKLFQFLVVTLLLVPSGIGPALADLASCVATCLTAHAACQKPADAAVAPCVAGVPDRCAAIAGGEKPWCLYKTEQSCRDAQRSGLQACDAKFKTCHDLCFTGMKVSDRIGYWCEMEYERPGVEGQAKRGAYCAGVDGKQGQTSLYHCIRTMVPPEPHGQMAMDCSPM